MRISILPTTGKDCCLGCPLVKSTDDFLVMHRDVPVRRNPGAALGVYCFVESDAAVREDGDEDSIRQFPRYVKESCDVPECGLQSSSDCQWRQDKGLSYTGSISTSQAGNECLPWTSV